MKSLFNIFTRLSEKLRLMIIKTFKKVLESQLKYCYLEINFKLKKYDNRYKLPLIAHVIDENEVIALQQNLIDSIRHNELEILGIVEPQLILSKEDLKRRKEIIMNTQKINGYETIKIILEKVNIENGIVKCSYSDEDIKEFKVNIVKKGDIPFQQINDLFVFKIDKSILED